MVDKQKAILDPGSVFSSPQQLLDDEELTQSEKIDILQRWAYDVTELAVAAEENMPGDDNHTTELLQDIHEALEQLREYKEDEGGGVTKHGSA